ncbi:hypothetical protein EDEG_01018 [Edhazardia aedis USNM 41457]|uniref:Uncharacterized protein n=1 Tax=Edhazardia aedis (strain USNM 41457) TaxID=1003232 RepID=J9DAL3_EDHAE|nr:hypothetical protein EDEG_01018 [Edhazardia aedis USNM 41457]|eukprot:EJW04796.1 hypothetical protein EDEG_01018 [Edhazardia aedis USNM 41457]
MMEVCNYYQISNASTNYKSQAAHIDKYFYSKTGRNVKQNILWNRSFLNQQESVNQIFEGVFISPTTQILKLHEEKKQNNKRKQFRKILKCRIFSEPAKCKSIKDKINSLIDKKCWAGEDNNFSYITALTISQIPKWDIVNKIIRFFIKKSLDLHFTNNSNSDNNGKNKDPKATNFIKDNQDLDVKHNINNTTYHENTEKKNHEIDKIKPFESLKNKKEEHTTKYGRKVAQTNQVLDNILEKIDKQKNNKEDVNMNQNCIDNLKKIKNKIDNDVRKKHDKCEKNSDYTFDIPKTTFERKDEFNTPINEDNLHFYHKSSSENNLENKSNEQLFISEAKTNKCFTNTTLIDENTKTEESCQNEVEYSEKQTLDENCNDEILNENISCDKEICNKNGSDENSDRDKLEIKSNCNTDFDDSSSSCEDSENTKYYKSLPVELQLGLNDLKKMKNKSNKIPKNKKIIFRVSTEELKINENTDDIYNTFQKNYNATIQNEIMEMLRSKLFYKFVIFKILRDINNSDLDNMQQINKIVENAFIETSMLEIREGLFSKNPMLITPIAWSQIHRVKFFHDDFRGLLISVEQYSDINDFKNSISNKKSIPEKIEYSRNAYEEFLAKSGIISPFECFHSVLLHLNYSCDFQYTTSEL